jgi:3-oxoacyl-[acyl-carrier protein] reductase
LKKVGEAKDIANAVAFLLSQESSWMTGQIMHIDGGISNLRV